jgi:hypothetical protein
MIRNRFSFYCGIELHKYIQQYYYYKVFVLMVEMEEFLNGTRVFTSLLKPKEQIQNCYDAVTKTH